MYRYEITSLLKQPFVSRYLLGRMLQKVYLWKRRKILVDYMHLTYMAYGINDIMHFTSKPGVDYKITNIEKL
jgi:hypothetical protein